MDGTGSVAASMDEAAEEFSWPAQPRPQLRPAPADFRARAAELGAWALKRHYRTGILIINRWYEETGAVRLIEPPMPVPADFVDVVARTHQLGLVRHYRVSNSTIRRWLSETGLTPAPRPRVDNPRRLPMPEDFPGLAPTLTRAQLADRLGVSDTVILRWCQEAGVRPMRSPFYRRKGGPVGQGTAIPPVDADLAAQAAQFLRRRKGRDHYYVNGRGVMPAAQMIELAEERGFDHRAWARLGAGPGSLTQPWAAPGRA
jgi:hypothetical protein